MQGPTTAAAGPRTQQTPLKVGAAPYTSPPCAVAVLPFL